MSRAHSTSSPSSANAGMTRRCRHRMASAAANSRAITSASAERIHWREGDISRCSLTSAMIKLAPRWRRYAAYYRGARRRIALTILLATLPSLIVLPGAWLVRRAFAAADPGRNAAWTLALLAVALFFLYLLKVCLALATRHLALATTKQAIAAMRMDLLELIYALPFGEVDRAGRPRVHHVIVQDTERVDLMSNALLGEAAPAA